MTHIARVEWPSSSSTRSRISWAALLVKVMARISPAPRAARSGPGSDAVGQHARLARAGAGEDQQRPLAVRDGLALGLVQALQEGVDAVLGSGLRHERSSIGPPPEGTVRRRDERPRNPSVGARVPAGRPPATARRCVRTARQDTAILRSPCGWPSPPPWSRSSSSPPPSRRRRRPPAPAATRRSRPSTTTPPAAPCSAPSTSSAPARASARWSPTPNSRRPPRGTATRWCAQGFFDHVSPGGATLVDRVRATGWLPADSYALSEAIAWADTPLDSAEQVVGQWIEQPAAPRDRARPALRPGRPRRRERRADRRRPGRDGRARRRHPRRIPAGRRRAEARV